MRRPNTASIRRAQELSEHQPLESLSDVSEIAEHLLKKGYRTARQMADEQYRTFSQGSDKPAARHWHLIGLWVDIHHNAR